MKTISMDQALLEQMEAAMFVHTAHRSVNTDGRLIAAVTGVMIARIGATIAARSVCR
jgi:hypothetical protein